MQRFIRSALAAASFALAGVSTISLAAAPTEAITKAVADVARPEVDRVRDADRKPAEVIAQTGIKAGSKIAEIMPGGGYFTRILSKVVGPTGVVYAWLPLPAPNAPPGGRDMAAPIRAIAADANYPNLKLADAAAAPPEAVDFVWTSLNYHDLHNRPNADLSVQNKLVWDALKPGGYYIVIDHAADSGSGGRDTSTLHRIDPELVKKEVLSVGFKLAKESDVLKHAADDHKKATRELERGKTDQFFFIFQKP